jgi:SpoVK/Ycf46/Vps4 family AAA+-type ATPase
LESNLIDFAYLTLNIDEWAEKLDGYSRRDIMSICRDAASMALEEQPKTPATDELEQWSISAPQIAVTNKVLARAAARRECSGEPRMIRRYEEWQCTKGKE